MHIEALAWVSDLYDCENDMRARIRGKCAWLAALWKNSPFSKDNPVYVLDPYAKVQYQYILKILMAS